MKILLDAGHFGKYNKYNGVNAYESEVMWKHHKFLRDELQSLGFEVGLTRADQKKDLAVHERGKKAKGYNLLLSLHTNACGTESVDRVVMIPYQTLNWTDIDDESMAIAQVLGKAVKKAMGISEHQIYQRKANSDRDGNGILDDEYYGILNAARAVGTPALIAEHGFHTNKKTAKWLTDDENLKKLAKAEADALAEYFGLKKANTTANATGLYCVQIGAYSQISNAEATLAKVKAAGFKDAVIVKNGQTVSTVTTAKKTIDEIAKEVINGKWGNGTERKQKLTAAGYNYKEVQKKVNELLK